MHKKLIAVVIVFAFTFLLSGCEKKSDVSIADITITPLPEELQGVSAGDDNGSATSRTGGAQISQEEDFITDAEVIDETFQQNYQVALADAQQALQKGVKYCGAKITFYGATMADTSIDSFVFYSDSFSKDYFWVVTLDGYQNNLKTRSFAARRDLADEIKCMTNTADAPGTISDIYEQLTTSDEFKISDHGTTAQTILETANSAWTVSVINNVGGISIRQTISAN